ncbi:MAG: IS1 family transposase [Planctomycetota bacterium]
MRKLPRETRALVIGALTEGMGINATARLCSVSKLTVLRLLADAGSFALDYHDDAVRNLPTTRVEVDELWAFVGCKQRTKDDGMSEGHGDAWTWVAIDADHKVAISYAVGKRDSANAHALLADLKARVRNRIQLTSDALAFYKTAVRSVFGKEIDFATLTKSYAAVRETPARYSPPVCTGCVGKRQVGKPDPDLISTSYIERMNLTTRVQTRRYTRLTNGWSRILSNHVYATALQFLAYNFVKKHATLKTTPAVAAGIASRPMTVLDIVDLIEARERRTGGRLSGYRPSPKRPSGEAQILSAP